MQLWQYPRVACHLCADGIGTSCQDCSWQVELSKYVAGGERSPYATTPLRGWSQRTAIIASELVFYPSGGVFVPLDVDERRATRAAPISVLLNL